MTTGLDALFSLLLLAAVILLLRCWLPDPNETSDVQGPVGEQHDSQ